jgi:stringent starvation protein B
LFPAEEAKPNNEPPDDEPQPPKPGKRPSLKVVK